MYVCSGKITKEKARSIQFKFGPEMLVFRVGKQRAKNRLGSIIIILLLV
jgi:hypothetical protein